MIHPQKHISQSMCAENPEKNYRDEHFTKCKYPYQPKHKKNEISMRNTAHILDIARSFFHLYTM